MGKAVLIDRPTVTNQQINSVVVDENVADCSFVYYSMLARRSELFQLGAGGSRTPILNKGDFERLPFVLPPLSEQRAIARILGAFDDKIELNEKRNETLEAMARALFKSWFVDFDPVRAKMDGRRPAGMDAETAALFPDSAEYRLQVDGLVLEPDDDIEPGHCRSGVAVAWRASRLAMSRAPSASSRRTG